MPASSSPGSRRNRPVRSDKEGESLGSGVAAKDISLDVDIGLCTTSQYCGSAVTVVTFVSLDYHMTED